MKVRLTVTVELEDPKLYELDDEGWPTLGVLGRVDREDVGQYVIEAVSSWGGQFAPGDVFFPRNIKSIRVVGHNFEIKNTRNP